MGKALILTILFCIVALANCGQRIDIILSGRDIPKDDVWSQPDPYVKVFYKFQSNQNWVSYGQTSVADDNPNPNWNEVFTFDYVPGSSQLVKYELWDSDVQFDDLVSTLELLVGDIVNSAIEGGGMSVERAFPPSGKGRLLMKVRIDGTIPFEADGEKVQGPLSHLLLQKS